MEGLPSDAVMLFLLAVECGEPVGTDGDRIEVTVDARGGGRAAVAVPDADLAELEDRQWVTIEESGLRLTERGRYWLARWAKSRTHKRR